MDLISRQAAIDALENDDRVDTLNPMSIFESVERQKAIEIICKLPSSQHWTPTASRLPDPGRYLVTVKRYGKKGNKTSVSNYNEGTWSGYDAEDVLAWMPMPEPMEGNA